MRKKIIILLIFTTFIVGSCLTNKEQLLNNVGQQERTWGIDISRYQEIYSWQKLKEQDIGFIFVKATEGSTLKDPKYTENYNNIRKIKIPVGSYHFFTHTSTGKNQAKNFLSFAKYKKGDLPLVLDAEFSKKMPSKEIVIKELKDFISHINNETGIYPIIYCPTKYYALYVKDHLPKKCKIWVVDYVNKPTIEWTFWQTTEKYKVQGIKGYVDFNQFNGTKKDLKKLQL